MLLAQGKIAPTVTQYAQQQLNETIHCFFRENQSPLLILGSHLCYLFIRTAMDHPKLLSCFLRTHKVSCGLCGPASHPHYELAEQIDEDFVPLSRVSWEFSEIEFCPWCLSSRHRVLVRCKGR